MEGSIHTIDFSRLPPQDPLHHSSANSIRWITLSLSLIRVDWRFSALPIGLLLVDLREAIANFSELTVISGTIIWSVLLISHHPAVIRIITATPATVVSGQTNAGDNRCVRRKSTWIRGAFSPPSRR
ncbi:hypothetical protein F5051DRAFT_436416 [Lentinula edodes]|nr:hypothetical protein F5051DRAFT_436416 [Lentinula edodes]